MKYYHMTNDKNFTINQNYNNVQQEMGKGLYITKESDLEIWDTLLRRRDYCIELNIDDIKIINEEDIPEQFQAIDELLNLGYTEDQLESLIENNMPTGDTFNIEPFDIAVKRVYSSIKGFDAIKPVLDKKEGFQIIVLNTNKVKLIKVFDTYDTIKEYKRNLIKVA